MKIALGSDHAGLEMKSAVKEYLLAKGLECGDFGTFCQNSVDYPDISFPVVRSIQNGEYDLGILVCGTGIGMSMAANKCRGIRAALCSDPYSARCSREHNNANVLALGARVVGIGLAIDIVDAFINTDFAAGRHQRRLDKITLMETDG
mgnify:CR=1 FL=1